MNETTRTLTFVGVAGALAVAAFGMHVATQPVSLEEYTDEQSEFYPNFKDPQDATGLQVAAYNDEAARIAVFNVEFNDGLWRIPSHHNYPADGEERLANTATSIIGLSREALATTSKDDHKRFGVLDPLDETITGTEGRGDRITLTKADEVLADYIIGTKIEDGPENTYHVRRADENRTYRATLDFDLSTKFADWIEPDLLDFRRGDIRELVIDRYSIDESRGVVVPGEQNELSRSSQDDPWQLAGLDETTEEVQTSTVNTMINALEDLAIVGVRPKPKGLSASLKGEGSGGIDARAAMDLEQKGFFIDSRNALVSNEGDVRLGTSDGVMYVLRFGEVFTGSDVEIEVGGSSDDADTDTDTETDVETDAEAEASDEESEESPDEGAAEDDSLKKNRYLFITAQFADSYIDPLDEQPVKPEPPADAEEAAGDNQDAEDEDQPDEAAEADQPAEGENEQPDLQAEYEQALADYEIKLKDWERSEVQRKEKVEAGQERVQELNRRFADWYYVISAETFDDIRVSREDLVEAKEPEATDDAEGDVSGTTLPAPEVKPQDAPAEEKEQPASDNDKPAADGTSESADKPEPEEKPADEPAGNEKPAAEEQNATPEDSPAK